MIVAAAIKIGDLICSMPAPHHHGDIISGLAAAGVPIPVCAVQGFLTSSGRFLDRREAAIRAVQKHQIPAAKVHADKQLYTDDLW